MLAHPAPRQLPLESPHLRCSPKVTLWASGVGSQRPQAPERTPQQENPASGSHPVTAALPFEQVLGKPLQAALAGRGSALSWAPALQHKDVRQKLGRRGGTQARWGGAAGKGSNTPHGQV